MKSIYSKLLYCLLLLNIYSFDIQSQDNVNWKFAEKFTADSLAGHYRSSLMATWIKDTHYFYYAVEKNGERIFYLVNAAKEKRNNFSTINI